MAKNSPKKIKEEDPAFTEETVSVEISEDVVQITVEKNTFFLDDEEEEAWFDKEKDEEEDELEMYFIDDDKSW